MQIRKMKFSSLTVIFMMLAIITSSCAKETFEIEEAAAANPELKVNGCWISGGSQSLLAWFPDMVGALNNCYPEDARGCAILGNVTQTSNVIFNNSGNGYDNITRDKNFVNGLLGQMKDRAQTGKPYTGTVEIGWIIQNIDLSISVTNGGTKISYTLTITYRRTSCPVESAPGPF